MLKRVHFAGIKSLLDLEMSLEPFTVLVGPNGCGKSTVLDLIELVTLAGHPNQVGNHVLGSIGEALQMAPIEELGTSSRDSAVKLEAQSTDERFVAFSCRPPIQVANLSLSRVVATIPSGACELDGQFISPTHTKNYHEFVRQHFSWSSQRLALSPSAIAAPSSVDLNVLHPSGAGLPTILKDLAGNHTDAYLALQTDMRKVVPHFRGLQLGKVRKGQESMNTLQLIMQQGTIPAHRASDGTLLALALLTATHNPDMPSLILMDDLDHGLHLSAQVALVEAIRAVMKLRSGLQVVCTTHSPVLLDCFRPEEVRVMALDEHGYTRARSLAERPKLDGWREGFSTGELWANLGEDWVVHG